MAISYSVDNFGTLTIYKGDYILTEISDCKNMTTDEITNLIEEVLSEFDIKIVR